MVPVPKGRPRMTRSGHVYTPQATHDAENTIRGYLKRAYRQAPLVGPVSVHIRFWMVKPKKPKHREHITKPDLTNLAKTVEDAANGLLYADDSQIVYLVLEKAYCSGGGEPGIDLEVVALDTP